MATYKPEVFETASLDEAQAIILTPEGDSSTEARWRTETPWMLERVRAALQFGATRLVMDFGCGVGRISRGLLEDETLVVLGLDASASIHRMAVEHVDSSRFSALSPEALDALVDAGLRCDAVLAVWVLQHCLDPAKELDRIRASLRRGGLFFIVDMHHRAVPTDEGWIDDGFSVRELVDARFECIQREPFAAPGSPQNLLQSGWVGVYRKP